MSGYIGSTPVPQATQHRESFTATEGQTTFNTAGYTPQFVDVYLNGSHLSPADFTASNGSDVVLGVAASADDVCDIVSYTPFEVANATFTGTTTTATASLDGAVVINESSADVDFRVESNGNANMLFVDGGNNAVVVGANDADTTISGGTPAFQVIGTGVATGVAVTRRENNAFGSSLYLSKSRNTTPDAFTVVQAGDTLGSIIFIGDDGTNLDTYGATINNVVKSGVGENDMPTELIFSTNSGTTTVAERMKIQHDSGNNVVIADGLTLTDGNLTVQTAHGIAFGNASGGTKTIVSNLLDDYEEGTFTPAVTVDSGSVGSITASGRYTKIGNSVTVTFSVQIGSASNALLNTFTGFPFTPSNITAAAVGAIRENGNTGDMWHIRATPNSTAFLVRLYDNSQGVVAGDTFLGSVTYLTNT